MVTLSIIDKYIVDNFYVKEVRQIERELGLNRQAIYKRVKNLGKQGVPFNEKFELDWYEYLNALVRIAANQNTNTGKWAKQLLEKIFKDDLTTHHLYAKSVK